MFKRRAKVSEVIPPSVSESIEAVPPVPSSQPSPITLDSAPIDPPFTYCIDFPNKVVNDIFFNLRGWITSAKGSAIENPVLVVGNKPVTKLAVITRPDVEKVYPDQAVIGFHQFVNAADLPGFEQFRIVFYINNMEESFAVPVTFAEEVKVAAATFLESKQLKHRKIRQVLACVVCGNSQLKDQPANLYCPVCRSSFPINAENKSYNFLSQELIDSSGVTSTDNVSSNMYAKEALELVEQFKDGLVLDNGAGLRRNYYSNVVNFEIVDYPTTDVLGVGEKLPFQTAVFDVVISVAVLEHVRDPFACAAEIVRVLKPGGILYAAVPFLQPFHGYPDHYYNMTSSGLKNLFQKDLEIVESAVPRWGRPIASLTWFLQSYVAGLPSDTAANFKEMKIGDLLANPQTYRDDNFVTQLPARVNEELACVNLLIARKPSA